MTTGLQFMEGGDKISPTECVRKYEDTGHETIVRELTQNALDAAREIGRECTLRFEIRELPTDALPGIQEYREHLCQAYMQEWFDKDHDKYVEVIERLRVLSQLKTTECLLVYDNGVGLDATSMEGLIGKGDSGKRQDDGGSGGTHGVGHETAFAAGDMHYVLYGGVSRDKNGRLRRVASGHVVFPTHLRTQPKARWGGHGYLSTDVTQNTLSGVAIIDNERQIPRLLRRQLDKLKDTGSVVIIPAFNRFPGDGEENGSGICNLICEDIAKHFFVAIDQDRLNVFVDDFTNREDPRRCRLDNRTDIENALSRVRENKRARGNRLVAGARSYEAWRTYRDGTEHSLTTSFGVVQARIRYTDSQVSRIAIMRAGMFITDDDGEMPRQLARSRFSSRKPFHAVLLFANDLNNPTTDADNILRDAENAGHSGIRSKREGVGRKVPQLFKELQQALLNVLEELPASRSYTPEILPILIKQGGSTSNPVPVPPLPEPGPGPGPRLGPGPGPRPGPGPGPNPRPVSRPLPVATSVVSNGSGKVDVEIYVPSNGKAVNNAVLLLRTRTGSDSTCESPLRSETVALDLAHCLLNGKAPGSGTDTHVRLGNLKPGQRLQLSLQLAPDVADGVPLRATLHRGRGQ